MDTTTCPKCGAENRERGELYPAGVLWDIRFQSENSLPFSFKKVTTAVACMSCGYIELFLSKLHEDTD